MPNVVIIGISEGMNWGQDIIQKWEENCADKESFDI